MSSNILNNYYWITSLSINIKIFKISSGHKNSVPRQSWTGKVLKRVLRKVTTNRSGNTFLVWLHLRQSGMARVTQPFLRTALATWVQWRGRQKVSSCRRLSRLNGNLHTLCLRQPAQGAFQQADAQLGNTCDRQFPNMNSEYEWALTNLFNRSVALNVVSRNVRIVICTQRENLCPLVISLFRCTSLTLAYSI